MIEIVKLAGHDGLGACNLSTCEAEVKIKRVLDQAGYRMRLF